jgi:hypothetical protein
MPSWWDPPGSGKTSALEYLAAELRRENHLVTKVELGQIESGDQLIVQIARSLLAEADPMSSDPDSEPDALAQLRAQFFEKITVSQSLSEAPQFIGNLILLVTHRLGLRDSDNNKSPLNGGPKEGQN